MHVIAGGGDLSSFGRFMGFELTKLDLSSSTRMLLPPYRLGSGGFGSGV